MNRITAKSDSVELGDEAFARLRWKVLNVPKA
jgi:hypothetical protein